MRREELRMDNVCEVYQQLYGGKRRAAEIKCVRQGLSVVRNPYLDAAMPEPGGWEMEWGWLLSFGGKLYYIDELDALFSQTYEIGDPLALAYVSSDPRVWLEGLRYFVGKYSELILEDVDLQRFSPSGFLKLHCDDLGCYGRKTKELAGRYGRALTAIESVFAEVGPYLESSGLNDQEECLEDDGFLCRETFTHHVEWSFDEVAVYDPRREDMCQCGVERHVIYGHVAHGGMKKVDFSKVEVIFAHDFNSGESGIWCYVNGEEADVWFVLRRLEERARLAFRNSMDFAEKDFLECA